VLATKASRNFFCDAPLAVPLFLLSQPWNKATTHKATMKRYNFFMIELGELVVINFVLDHVLDSIFHLQLHNSRRMYFHHYHYSTLFFAQIKGLHGMLRIVRNVSGSCGLVSRHRAIAGASKASSSNFSRPVLN
jgi:hypothetical protein